MAPSIPELPPMELGYPRTPLRRKLIDAVLQGVKTATAGLRADFAPFAEEPLPRAGGRWFLLDFDGEPAAVVETAELRVLRVDEVDLDFARDEAKASGASPTGAVHTRSFWSDRQRGRHSRRRRVVQARRTLVIVPGG